ncbi:MAG TPA: hypothetical protein VFF14_09965 [Candidatus Deferrimicrobium sp.]|nr:hypothetical protein [Candidatus Deferrimicrobium sp.]
MKKKKRELLAGGRVLVKFNTGTKPHKSKKDYKRTPKHKKDLLGGSSYYPCFFTNSLLSNLGGQSDFFFINLVLDIESKTKVRGQGL